MHAGACVQAVRRERQHLVSPGLQRVAPVPQAYARSNAALPAPLPCCPRPGPRALQAPAGEPELLMASRVLRRPISVYQPGGGGLFAGGGSSSPAHIVTYGEDLLGGSPSKQQQAVAPMHLLWSGQHYDLLLPLPAARL